MMLGTKNKKIKVVLNTPKRLWKNVVVMASHNH